LPGRVPVPPRLGALLAGLIEGALSRIEPVAGSVESFLGPLQCGQSIGERALGRLQPAAQASQLPHRFPAFPRLVDHIIEDARRLQHWRPVHARLVVVEHDHGRYGDRVTARRESANPADSVRTTAGLR
jgi:hypothetical protein